MLEKISFFGFKSFADRVDVNFSDGITAVIGPNGCGKSNINDGIRWVLGEQSAKSLRGGKMDDVIFNGSEARKPRDFAEVSLTLNNSKGYLKNLKDNSVTVTRRITRGGGSEFFINNEPARLKDIHELFLDSGIGSNSYSIIGQGQIEKILSTRLDDRRAIFEEASGIVKLKHQKEQTESRLKDVDDNLLRVEDIVREIEKQLKPLKEQARKASDYKELSEQLKMVEIQYLLHEYDQVNGKIIETKGRISELDEQISSLSGVLTSNEELLQEKKDTYTSKNDKLIAEHEIFSSIKEEIENIFGRINVNAERLSNSNRQITDTEESIKEIENNYSLSAEDIKLKQNRQQDISFLLSEKEELSKRLVEKLSELENFKIQLATEIEITRNSSTDLYTKLSQEKYELEQSFKKEKELEVSLREQQQRLDEILKSKVEAESEYDNAEKKFLQLTSDVHITQNEITKKRIELQSSKEQHDSNLSQMQFTENQLIRQKSKLENVENFIENNESFYDGVKAVLKMKKEQGKMGIYGAVAELVKVKSGLEVALEKLLQSSMQYLVIEDDQVAKECISYLKENKLGQATFLPLNLANPSSFTEDEKRKITQSSGISLAINGIEYDSKFEPIMQSLLGRSVIAENLDTGLEFVKRTGVKAKVSTLDGEVIQSGSISGGVSQKQKTSYFGKVKELEELKGIVSSLEIDFEKCKSLHIDLQTTCQRLDIEINDLVSKYDLLKENVQEAKNFVEDSKRKLSYLDDEYQRFEVNQKESKLSLQEIRDSVLKLTLSIEEKEENHNSLVESLNSLNQRRDDNEKELISHSERKTALALETSTLTQESAQIKEYLDSFNEDAETVEQKITSLYEKKEKETVRIEELNATKTMLEDEMKQATEKSEKQNEMISFIKIDIQTLLSEIESLEQSIKSSREEKESFEKEQNQKQVFLGRKETERANVESRLKDTYEILEDDVPNIERLPIDVSSSKKEIEGYKRKISALGTINHAAIEESAALEDRYINEKKQLDDVKEAKGDLLKLLKNVEDEMTLRFTTTFNEIAEHFSRIFVDLFEGGKAKLTLEDPSNPLGSAIEIIAQPTGKKPQSISQLSGGEKAFTAVALIFAIISAKPSPFIILDEVDAPLDDANVARFAYYLKKFSDKSQFIIVTHRKGTMMVSDYIYGVTQEERGVSIVLPSKLDLNTKASG